MNPEADHPQEKCPFTVTSLTALILGTLGHMDKTDICQALLPVKEFKATLYNEGPVESISKNKAKWLALLGKSKAAGQTNNYKNLLYQNLHGLLLN